MLSLKPYRRAAVPILAVQTPDPAEVLRLALRESVNGSTSPVLTWDCIHGITPANGEAQIIAAELNSNQDAAIATSNPIEFLRAIEGLADKAILVAHGLADVLTDPSAGTPTRQALWNLRDALSQSGALLVLTFPVGWSNPYPDDIAVDVMSLPTAKEHKALALKICKDAGLPEDVTPDNDALIAIGDALLGLSGFAAEQALALSISKAGIDIDSLRARKRQQISETPSLSVYTGKETFDDLKGIEQVKDFFNAVLTSDRKPGGIVFVDEIEKYLGNVDGDTSGTGKALLGYILSYMDKEEVTGAIFVGPPGAAKSAFTKAMGNQGGIPNVIFDLGGTKDSLVGNSEKQARTALSVIDSVTGEKPLFIATCNKISVLPPELRRRFTLGTFFFDLPTVTERTAIWEYYVKKYNLDAKQPIPLSEGWTGAEIKQCTDMADRLGKTLEEAASFVVPVSVSAREVIDALRKEASGRYLSASAPGVYVYGPQTGAASARKVRI